MATRELEWRPITEAPNGQRVLLWNRKEGTFHTGRVRFIPSGAYEIETDDLSVSFNISEYAVVEGP